MFSLQQKANTTSPVKRQLAFGTGLLYATEGGSSSNSSVVSEEDEPTNPPNPPTTTMSHDGLDLDDDDDLMDLPPFEALMSPLNEIFLGDGTRAEPEKVSIDHGPYLSDCESMSDEGEEGDETRSLVRELNELEAMNPEATNEFISMEINGPFPSKLELETNPTLETIEASSSASLNGRESSTEASREVPAETSQTDSVTSRLILTRLSEVTTEGELRKHILSLIGKEFHPSLSVVSLDPATQKPKSNRATIEITRSAELSEDEVITLLNRTLLHGSTIRCSSCLEVKTTEHTSVVSVQISKLAKKTTKDSLRKHLLNVMSNVPATTIASLEMRQNKRHTGHVATVSFNTTTTVHEVVRLINKSKFLGSMLMSYEMKSNGGQPSPRNGPPSYIAAAKGVDKSKQPATPLQSVSSVVTESTVASKDDEAITFNVSGIQLSTSASQLAQHIMTTFGNDVVIESLALKKNQRKTGQVATIVARSNNNQEGMSNLHKSELQGKLLNAYMQTSPVANHHPNDGTVATNTPSPPNGKKKKRPRKRTEKERAQIEEAKELAELFHMELLCSLNEDLNVDREDVATLFRKFLVSFSSSERSDQEKRRLETLVVMNMRQRQLIRSRRYDDKVVLTIAGMGGPGDFPTEDAEESGTKRVLERRALEEEDKNGVTVTPKSSCDNPVVLPLAGTTRFELTIKSADSSATLQAAGLGGSSARLFAFDPPVTDPVKFGDGGLTLGIKFEAEDRTCGVGVKRAIVKMGFVTSTGRCIITRSLAVSVQTDSEQGSA